MASLTSCNGMKNLIFSQVERRVAFEKCSSNDAWEKISCSSREREMLQINVNFLCRQRNSYKEKLLIY